VSKREEWVAKQARQLREVMAAPGIREELLDLFSGEDDATREQRREEQARESLRGAGLRWHQRRAGKS